MARPRRTGPRRLPATATEACRGAPPVRLGEVEGEGIGVVFPGESLHVGEVQDLGAEEDPEREPAGKPGVINGCGGGGGSSSSSSSLEAHNPTGRRKTGGLGGRRDESGGSATYIETGTNTISGAVGRLRRCNGPRCVLCVLIGGLPTGCRALCSFRGTCFIYFHLLWKPTNVNDKAWVGVCATLSGAAGGGQRAAGSGQPALGPVACRQGWRAAHQRLDLDRPRASSQEREGLEGFVEQPWKPDLTGGGPSAVLHPGIHAEVGSRLSSALCIDIHTE